MALRELVAADHLALDHRPLIEARVMALGNGVALAAWDDADGRTAGKGVRASRAGRVLPAPFASVALATEGTSRCLAAFRFAPLNAGAPVFFVGPDGRALAHWVGALPLDDEPIGGWLVAGLPESEHGRLTRFLLQTVRTLFRLDEDSRFAAACLRLLSPGARRPWTLQPRCMLTADLVLASADIATPSGALGRALILGAEGVRPLAVPPGITAGRRPDRATLYLPIPVAPSDGRSLVAFPEAAGTPTAVPDLMSRRLPSLLAWLESRRTDPVRDYLAGVLATLGRSDVQAAAAARELQLCLPFARRRVAKAKAPVSGDVELAIGHGAGGLFLAGWLNDPHHLVEAIEAVAPDGRRRRLPRPDLFIPRPEIVRKFVARDAAPAGARVGFVLYAAGEGANGPGLQHRFAFRLRSGALVEGAAPPQPTDFAAARAAILASVPAPHLDADTLERCIAPAVAALHARHMADRPSSTVVTFGEPPARPVISIIVPLYRNLDFLRFQVAAFAIDPAFAQVELIYVLDSPEQRETVEHLLTGLHGLYDLAIRLVVMPRNYGYAAANNAGSAIARGQRLLFLNSDVVPDRPGWLPALDRAVTSDPHVAAAGAKLLFDDDSLQHAGLYFGRDWRGRWLNRHFHKGLPRHFPPASRARSVPAVTGACLLMRRDVYDAVGGFTEDYIIGDYEDSDLCLKARAIGFDIRYEPAAELYHLERQSIEQHPGYSRGVASEYNCWLHGKRWAADISLLMGVSRDEPDRAVA